MPVVRVYLPLGSAELDGLAEHGQIPAGPDTPRAAFAVTAALAEGAPGLDEEDLEYAAFADAVAAAASARTSPGQRRVVAAADADPSWVVPGDGSPVSRVAVVQGVPMARVASFHIDEHGGALDGSADDEADELLWYDVTELDDVRAMVR